MQGDRVPSVAAGYQNRSQHRTKAAHVAARFVVQPGQHEALVQHRRPGAKARRSGLAGDKARTRKTAGELGGKSGLLWRGGFRHQTPVSVSISASSAARPARPAHHAGPRGVAKLRVKSSGELVTGGGTSLPGFIRFCGSRARLDLPHHRPGRAMFGRHMAQLAHADAMFARDRATKAQGAFGHAPGQTFGLGHFACGSPGSTSRMAWKLPSPTWPRIGPGMGAGGNIGAGFRSPPAQVRDRHADIGDDRRRAGARAQGMAG